MKVESIPEGVSTITATKSPTSTFKQVAKVYEMDCQIVKCLECGVLLTARIWGEFQEATPILAENLLHEKFMAICHNCSTVYIHKYSIITSTANKEKAITIDEDLQRATDYISLE